MYKAQRVAGTDTKLLSARTGHRFPRHGLECFQEGLLPIVTAAVADADGWDSHILHDSTV